MTKKLHEENSCNLWPIPSADMQWVSRGGRETPTIDLTFNPGHKSLARVTLNFMLFLTQTAIGYEELWVEGVPSKMLKQRVKKTKAEPSGHKKKTKPKNKQLASLTIQQFSTNTQIHLWTLPKTVLKWVTPLKDKELSNIALSTVSKSRKVFQYPSWYGCHVCH